MGNSSSTQETSSSKKKRSRDEEENEEGGGGGKGTKSHKNLSKRSKKSSQVAGGRLLVKNCRVWTWGNDGLTLETPNVDDVRPRRRKIDGVVSSPQWLCVDHYGRISNISEAPIIPDEDNFETVIDAAGQVLLPGLMDAHIHVMLTGESAYYLDLQGCTSISQLQSMLSKHIEAHSDLPWIVGVNWDQTPFGRYPTRYDLDECSLDTPVFLWRACWHIGVANTAALRKAGVDLAANSIHVEGGGEVECSTSGPTGILKESAVQLVAEAMGKKSFEEKTRFISEGLSRCCKMGLTSVQTNDEYAIDVYQALMNNKVEKDKIAQEGGLPCRVFLTPVYEETLPENNVLPSTPTSMNEVDVKNAVISPSALATATKNEKSSLLSFGLRSPQEFTGIITDAFDSTTPLENIFKDSNLVDLGSQQTHLCIERVKIFGDGSLGAETAAITLLDSHTDGGLLTSDKEARLTETKNDEKNFNDTSSESVRVVKINFPLDMEMDYSFQELLQKYMQLYGAVSQISYHTCVEGDSRQFAEVLFKDEAGAKKCVEEWESVNPSSGSYKLTYVGDNSFGETILSMHSKGDIISTKEPVGDYKGILTHNTKDLTKMIAHCKRLGYRVEIHAIGDAAAAQALYCIMKGGMLPSDRPVLTHCQILSEEIVRQMRHLGVIANVQPSFVPTDMKWVMDRVSEGHLKWAYPWRTLLDTGVVVSGGSDAPIETCCPFTGMHDAILRRSRSTMTNDGHKKDSVEDGLKNNFDVFREEECVTFAEALWMYTVGASIAANCENLLGQVKVNYAADLVLVNSSVCEDPTLLLDYAPEVVIVGGKVRHINPITAPLHGVTISGNVSSCLPGPSLAISEQKKLDGPYVPGKNGKLFPPQIFNTSGQVGTIPRDIGLPRGSGFCACWLRGRHCKSGMYDKSNEVEDMNVAKDYCWEISKSSSEQSES